MTKEWTPRDKTVMRQILHLEEPLREEEKELRPEDVQEVRGGFSFTRKIDKSSPVLF